jgi:hypothetical protein
VCQNHHTGRFLDTIVRWPKTSTRQCQAAEKPVPPALKSGAFCSKRGTYMPLAAFILLQGRNSFFPLSF